MRKWLLLPFFLLVSLLAAVSFVGYTQTGLHFVQQLANGYSKGLVKIEKVEGRLFSSFTLEGLHVQAPGLHVDAGEIAVGWNPSALFGGKLEVTGLRTDTIFLNFVDSGKEKEVRSGPFSLPSMLLPLRCSISKIDIDGLVFQDAGEEVYRINRLGGDFGATFGTIIINDFFLYSHDVDLKIHGTIDVQHHWQLDLLGNYRFVGYGFHELRGTFSFSKALEAPHVEFGVNSPGDIRIVGDVRDLFSQFSWHALLSANQVNLAELIEYCPEIMLHTVSGDIDGNLDGYGGNVSADGTWGVMDNLQLETTITADWWGIVFDRLQIARKDGLAVATNASINWRELFDWEGDFDFQAFDPEPLAKVLKGRLSAQFRSVGKVRDEGLSADFNIDKIGGVLNERPVSGAGTLHLTESGISSDDFTLTSGELEGLAHIEQGSFSWENEMPWGVELQLEHFDLSGLLLDLEGDVSGRVAVQGGWPDDNLRGRLDLTELRGNVRGLVLSGGGEIDFMGEAVETSGFRLQLGDAFVDVRGRASNDLNVDFTADVPAIERLLTGYRGAIKARGTVGGTLSNPAIDARFNGSHLTVVGEDGVASNSIAGVSGRLSMAGGEDQQLSLVVDAVDGRLGGYRVNDAQLKVSGTQARHLIEVGGNGGFGKMRFSASGGFNGGWVGHVDGVTLSSAYGTWRQAETAALTLTPAHMALSRLCIGNGDASACVAGEWQKKDENPAAWRLGGEATNIGLAWLNATELLTLPVDGIFNGNIEASGQGAVLVLAKGDINLPEADVEFDVEDEDLANLVLDDTRFSFDLYNGLLLAEGDTRIHGDGTVALKVRVDGMHRLTDSLLPLPIDGSVSFNNFDMALLSAFTGNYLQPTGKVTSTITVGGTVGSPGLQGKLIVDGGGIFLPYQGVTLENLDLNVVAAEDGAYIVCSTTSGPGKATARGRLHWRNGIGGSFAITGKDFLLVSLPEYTFRVNPALEFDFSGKQASMSGMVTVPYGRITPEEMTDSISVSEDVIFINGVHEEEIKNWPVQLDIGVKMGDDVQVDGYGLTGKVAGQLKVKTARDKVLTGEGRISLKDASFTLYGRSLDIVRGRLLFSGGAIDNPGVDVRAQKKVSDEEAKGTGYTVGVDISGYVQDLQYHLFSDPYMEETEIVSRMLIGTSLANATPEEGGLLEAALVTLGVQGSGRLVKGLGSFLTVDDLHLEGSSSKEDVSLVIGKRVTEDLYIGYDVNMFSRLGQFRVRYDLTHGFAVETKSSSESTGADLLYSIER